MSTDLHFCNFCQQSVPADKLESGDAIRHGGRVVCPTCCDTLMLATSSRSEEQKPVSLVLPLVIGFVGWGLALFAWFSHDQYQRSAEERFRTHQTSTDDALTNHIEKFQDSLASREAGDAALAKRLDGVGADLTALGKTQGEGFTALQEAVAPLVPLQDAHAATVARLTELETNVGVLEELLRETRSQQEFLRDEVQVLARQLQRTGPREPDDGEFPDDIKALLGKLQDDDPLTRATALEALGRSDDPRLAAYVEPLLNDTYEMNRFYAAYALGEMGALVSCPSLVKALGDDYSFVRKAAFEALQKVTGQDLPFDHKAELTVRDPQKKAWSDWWEANKERLLVATPDPTPTANGGQ